MNNFNTQKWISQSYSTVGHKVTPLLTVFQASFLGKNILNEKFNGGSVWESNHTNCVVTNCYYYLFQYYEVPCSRFVHAFFSNRDKNIQYFRTIRFF